MTPTLDGPRKGPARGGQPDALVVLVHGYGANGADLIGLAEPMSEVLPGAAFAAPDAPSRLAGAPDGRMWFAIDRIDPARMEAGVRSAAPALESFIDRELTRTQVPPERLVLVGFSQGTMLSLHVGPRRSVAPAAVVGFSGALCGAQALKAEARSAPPFFLIHGDRDEVVPAGLMLQAADALAGADLGAVWSLRAGLAHGIDPEGLQHACGFIRRCLAR